MKKIIGLAAFCLSVFSVSTALFGERFFWSVERDLHYRVTAYIQQERYLNGASLGAIEIRNKEVFQTLAVSNTNAALYKGTIEYSTREVGAREQAFALKEVYSTEFWRDVYGKYFIAPDKVMPVIRDIPLFSKNDIQPGAMWQADGYEVHDLKNFGLAEPHRIPFTARYNYIGDRVINGKRMALFSIMYVANHSVGIDLNKFRQDARAALSRYRAGTSEYNTLKEQQDRTLDLLQLAPQHVSGSCMRLYHWDIDARLPYSTTEDFDFIFTHVNGDVYQFKGSTERFFERIEPIRERDAEAIVRSLQGGAAGISAGPGTDSGISVHRDERGIVVELADILFDIDSAQLKPEALARLTELSKRINSSGKFEIRVEGHTDNTGAADYNLQLSQKRAREVANFLTKNLNAGSQDISWIGHGMTKPAASNFTAAGRAKNRRVEIILLTNE
jgi:outer membrane protein OmpA-like peptidoglycan-associated protein